MLRGPREEKTNGKQKNFKKRIGNKEEKARRMGSLAGNSNYKR